MKADFKAGLGRALTVVLALPLLLKGLPAFAEEPTAEKNVVLHVKISDESSGLTLEAKKDVPAVTSAFDALRDIVSVRFVTYPSSKDHCLEVAVVVTGLCGVEQPKGRYWALYVDGKKAHEDDIGRILLTKDTLIEWKMQRIEQGVKAP